jgi:hypothetical protein
MAKYSKKMMGKEVGDAAVYAEPHTMTGKKVKVEEIPGKPSELTGTNRMRMSVGMYNNGPVVPTKTDGIKVRGNGAATKGLMARGPMA